MKRHCCWMLALTVLAGVGCGSTAVKTSDGMEIPPLPDGADPVTTIFHGAMWGVVSEIKDAVGADPNSLTATNEDGETALHVAAGRAMWPAVEALVAAGANLSATDNSGRTPYAVADERRADPATLDLLTPK